jgi:hypothetical protein
MLLAAAYFAQAAESRDSTSAARLSGALGDESGGGWASKDAKISPRL